MKELGSFLAIIAIICFLIFLVFLHFHFTEKSVETTKDICTTTALVSIALSLSGKK